MNWGLAQTFEMKPAEITNAHLQNQSCDPFTPAARPCELGNYATYSINVTGAQDVVAGMRFAQQHNIRMVIKTSGHDYMGKSTGFGALSLWMWNLKTADIISNYTGTGYSGPAMKVGSGTVSGEALQVAAQAGYRLVGGECASVGLGAGYTQGGGHSILSSAYGLAADSVLEWEVVTAQGQHLVASPEQNADLYWALSGGGGGTYGVVLSMTVRLYPDGPVAGGSLSFNLTDSGNNETLFWHGVELWHRHLPSLVADNNTVLYNVENNTLGIFAFTLPDQHVGTLESLVSPFLAQLEEWGISYVLETEASASYVDHFNKYFGPLPYGAEPITMMSSRMVPRSVILDPTANTGLVDTLRSIVSGGEFLVGCNALNVANGGSLLANAVLPAWRDTIALCAINAFLNYTAPLSQNIAAKKEMVNIHVPALEAATPGSGVYLNEVDPLYEGDWKQTMYGSNYDSLLQVKQLYDPGCLLYAQFAVGSDEYTIDDSGRLCRKE
ncbi:hypothetical protein VMCG_10909 [Cytospora schulzeri]|uniref:FAD-binding PCMH-type domain-containing protein n=1 Tax=Cytospora schulzeri TaxID=448051 RepID=A0A423V7L2_9PEZI|nr:hypothetical protein VMCG_10909 [Valsa malicola]